jgi:hypothetical protein
MGKVIGKGYLKGGGNGIIQKASKVQVFYNKSGGIISFFPLL